MKRMMDIVISVLLLPVMLFLCLPASLGIWLYDKANPFFMQTRVGKEQRPFTLYKLRTMAVNTGDIASHEVSAIQITKFGDLLRRTKVDELPQLINVLLGHMSLVGPRPCLPVQKELIDEREKRNVFAMRPGITGPAQVASIDMSTPVLLAETDATYLTTQNFAGDLKLMLQTVTGSGQGDAAKRS